MTGTAFLIEHAGCRHVMGLCGTRGPLEPYLTMLEAMGYNRWRIVEVDVAVAAEKAAAAMMPPAGCPDCRIDATRSALLASNPDGIRAAVNICRVMGLLP